MNRAIFLDRDGVINDIIYHQDIGIIDTPFTTEQFNLLPNVGRVLNILHQMNFKVILVSNQPGIAKFHYTLETFEEIRNKMKNELSKYGAFLDAEYYCLHHPNAKNLAYKIVCECRKPKPGMLLNAADELKIDLKESWIVGDSITDIKAGKSAECRTILISNMKCDLCKLMDKEKIKPDFIVTSIIEVPNIINGEKKHENIFGHCEYR